MSRRLWPPHKLGAATVAAALLPVALGAALAEAFALRLVLRMGQALPAQPGLGEFFGAVAAAGVIAQNLAAIAGTLTLAALALDRLTADGVAARMSGVLLLAAALLAALLAAGAVGVQAWLAAYALLVTVIPAAFAAAPGLPLRGGRAWLLLPLAAYGALAYHFSAPAAAGLGAGLPFAVDAYFLAEGLAVAAALALPLAVRGWFDVRRVTLAAALPAVVLLALLARPWIVASLSVWTFGFTLFLPAVLYPLALAAFLASVMALAQAGHPGRRLAVGLAFMALGGLKLDYSYFYLLVLLAITYLTAEDGQSVAAATPPVAEHAAVAPRPVQKAG